MKVMKFYCTAGRGTEIFLEKELKDTFQNSVDQVSLSKGNAYSWWGIKSVRKFFVSLVSCGLL